MAKTRSLFEGQPEPGPGKPKGLPQARDLKRLFDAGRVSDPFPELFRLQKEYPDIAAAFAWLRVYGDILDHEEKDNLLLACLISDPRFSQKQRDASAKAACQVLGDAVKDRSVPDEIKVILVGMLKAFNPGFDDSNIQKYFTDFKAALVAAKNRFLANLSEDPDRLLPLVDSYGLFLDDEEEELDLDAFDELIGLAMDSAAAGHPAGAFYLAVILAIQAEYEGIDPAEAQYSIDAMANNGSARALWCLETLAGWPGTGVIRDQLDAARKRLEKAGVRAEGPPRLEVPQQPAVSGCDGSGSRMVFLETGEKQTVTLMLNDIAGVRQVIVMPEEAGMMESYLHDTDSALLTARTTTGTVRDLLADALAENETTSSPVPWRLFALLPLLGGEPLRPALRELDLSAFSFADMAVSPDLVADSGKLIKSTIFGCLVPGTEEMYAFCREHMPKRGDKLGKKDFEAFLAGPMRDMMETLKYRMAVNLEVAAWAGQAETPEAMRAARLWHGLNQGVAEPEKVPFIRELASSAAAFIIEDIRNGFDTAEKAMRRDLANPFEAMQTEGLEKLLFGKLDPEDLKEAMAAFLDSSKLAQAGKAAGAGAAAKKETPRKRPKSDTVYRFEVRLLDSPMLTDDFMKANPKVIREVELLGHHTLMDLHEIIFDAFDRDDEHLFEFQFGKKPRQANVRRYVHPYALTDSPWDDKDALDATAVTLDELRLDPKAVFFYWFDFGDDWWHEIKVKEIGKKEGKTRYPRIVLRVGDSPPQYPDWDEEE